jgi:allantoate deiminase
LDVRHYENHTREQFLKKTKEHLKELARKNNVIFQKKLLGEKKTVECSSDIKNSLDKAFQKQNMEPYRLVSGAGHDAMIMAKKIPMAMLFLRSPNGVSHHPSEVVKIPDITKMLAVLTEFFMDSERVDD